MSFPIFGHPKQGFFDSNGVPLSSGTLTITDPSTDLFKATYPTADDADAATNANANPLTLDSRGEPGTGFFGVDGETYKIVLKDSDGNTIWTVDDVKVPLGSRASIGEVFYPRTTAEIAASVTPTNYFYPEGNVLRYGASGDGVANDGSAVLSAINVSEAGVPAYFPEGYTFLCSSWTQHTTTAAIRLYGGGTIKGNGSVIFLKPAFSVVLEDITFDTWLQVVDNQAADSGTIDNFEVTGCLFNSIGGNTLDVERPINRAFIANNRFTSCSNYPIRIGKNDYSLQDTWQKLVIDGNYFNDVSSTGTSSATPIICYGKDAAITNNMIEDVDSSGGSGEAAGIYTKVRQAVISGNVIKDIVGAGADSTIVGINIKGNSRGSTASPQGFNTIVSDNAIVNAGGYGIRAQCDEVIISNNLIEEPGNSAISVDSSGSNIIVSANRGYVASPGTTIGVRCAWNGERVRITDNVMEGFLYPCNISAAESETLSYLLVEGNLLAAGTGGSGVRFNVNALGTLTYPVVRGNIITSDNNGIVLDDTGTTTGLVIELNDLRDSSTEVSGTAPTGTVFRNNLGYITSNGGVTSAIATGSTVTHGMSVTPTIVNVSALDSGTADIYITAIGATTFTINYGGGGTHVFAWEAKSGDFY